MNTKEIDEMKRLGVVKRKDKFNEGEFEFCFKLACKDCGGKVDWCNCTKTLEDAKKVMASQTMFHCWDCASKEENCEKDVNDQITEMIKDFPSTTREEAYMEIISEGYWDEEGSHETSDGIEYYDCECSTGM